MMVWYILYDVFMYALILCLVYVLIHALNMWRHYLLGRRFILMSDHIRLRYLFDKPNLNTRQAICLISILGTSKVKRTGWQILSVGEYR